MSKRELDVITLRGLSAVGSHGVHEFERSGSQVFSADIKLYVDVAKAAKTDQVEYTVDYSAMAEDAVKILTGRRWLWHIGGFRRSRSRCTSRWPR